jgi:hypothetical protein
VVLLAGGSISALLADLYGIAPMHLVFLLAALPSMAALLVVGASGRVNPQLRQRIRVGAIAGAVGTLGYDLARVPFALLGQRVFAPIDSYGLLIADASASSGLTAALGWLYHLSNGVTFGIAYAAVAARRGWGWGVAWGLLLETVAIASPFADRYGLAGQAGPITVAYLGHIFYGLPLGWLVQHLDGTVENLAGLGRSSVAIMLVASVAVIVGWHRPWARSPTERAAGRLFTPGSPATVVLVDRFEPQWLRVRPGGCVLVDNRSGATFPTPYGTIEPNSPRRLCLDGTGAHRIRLGTRAYSGGFIYVDPYAS